MQLPTQKLIYLLLLLLFFSSNVLGQTALSSEAELIDKANELFEAQDFEEAKPLYSQLLSLYPKEPVYNYKYGACLLMVGNDREQGLEYIQYAVSRGGIDDKAHFYLGKAYHYNYDFNKAIEAYKKYKERASTSEEKALKVDHHIQMCENGKSLLKKFKGVKVLRKQEMTLENFYRVYESMDLKGQILSKPQKFMSKYDQKVNESSVMFFPENAKELYFSSYGEKGENGKDIYKVILMGNGKWSDPINLGNVINTSYDEDFAFVLPGTKRIYFASTGHNSMGGYDLFTSTYDPNVANWTTVENLDFPYSTVDNDYLYVQIPDDPIAYFASDRFKPEGVTTVYKVNTEEIEPELAVIKGKFTVEDSSGIQKATITVKDEEGNLVSRIETDKNSDYEIAFNKNGGSYIFNLETTNDSPIHSGKIELPDSEGLNVYTQELELKGDKENQTLIIKNDFEPNVEAENDIAFSPEILKGQSQLTVNSSDENLLAQESANDGVEDGNNAQSEAIEERKPKSGARSKEEINQDFLELKERNRKEIENKSNMLAYAYHKADVHRTKAEEKYEKAEQQSKQQSISSLQEANLDAARAIAYLKIAEDIQNELDVLEKDQENINVADNEIAQLLLDNKHGLAEEQLLELRNTLIGGDQDGIEKSLLQVRHKLDSAKKENLRLKAKENNILGEKAEIKAEIAALEEELEKANKGRKEEIRASINNYELDIKDLDFRLKFILDEKQHNQQIIAENKIKKNSLEELTQVSTAEYNKRTFTGTEKEAIATQIAALQDSRRPIEALSLVELDSEESINNSSSGQVGEEEMDEPIVQAQNETAEFNDLLSTSKEPNGSASSDGSVENEIEDSKLEQTVGKSTVELNSEDTDIYTIPAAIELRRKAITIDQESQQKYKEYNDLLLSIKSLPTEEERTEAFEKAHKIQDEAQKLEIEAAIINGNANKIQYLRNNARLRSMGDSPIPNANTNMMLLLNDEAAIYYEQAQQLRDGVQLSDRFSKKETILTDALVLEEKALKKQEQALKLMNNEEDKPVAQQSLEELKEKERKNAEVLQSEYKQLTRRAEELREEANEVQNTKMRDSLLALAETHDSVAGRKLVQSNVLYVRSNEEGLSQPGDPKSSPVIISPINEPEVIDSSSIAEMDENVKAAIISSPEFKEYQQLYEEKEDLVVKTFEVHQKAQLLEKQRDSLIQRENELRRSAVRSESDSVKVRMLKEAVVVNTKIASINSSLDSASKIIKLRNYLIQKKEQNLEQITSNMEDSVKAEQITLLAKVVYKENKSGTEEVPAIAEELQQEAENTNDLSESEVSNEPSFSESGIEDKAEEEQLTTAENNPEDLEQAREVVKENDEKAGVVGDFEEDSRENEIATEEIIEVEPEFEVPVNEAGTIDSKVSFLPTKVEEDIFKLKDDAVEGYNNSKPIPIDPVLPEGIVYQVQVGAFRNPIPQDHFKGFAPLMGMTAANGITRYTAGIFNDFPEADQAKVEIRKLGYKDAFVVAFLNGKRIPIPEAIEKQSPNAAGSASDQFFTTEALPEEEKNEGGTKVESQSGSNTETVNATNSKSINGVYFSIQVGVFSKPLSPGELGYDDLLIVDELPSGLYRYHIGIFDDLESAKDAHSNNISKDIPDSFVVAYHNGERISISQAIAIISNR